MSILVITFLSILSISILFIILYITDVIENEPLTAFSTVAFIISGLVLVAIINDVNYTKNERIYPKVEINNKDEIHVFYEFDGKSYHDVNKDVYEPMKKITKKTEWFIKYDVSFYGNILNMTSYHKQPGEVKKLIDFSKYKKEEKIINKKKIKNKNKNNIQKLK